MSRIELDLHFREGIEGPVFREIEPEPGSKCSSNCCDSARLMRANQ